jgi:hypothetical protein
MANPKPPQHPLDAVRDVLIGEHRAEVESQLDSMTHRLDALSDVIAQLDQRLREQSDTVVATQAAVATTVNAAVERVQAEQAQNFVTPHDLSSVLINLAEQLERAKSDPER